MKHVTLQEAEKRPVSHDPTLVKELLIGSDTLPCIDSISHIKLSIGTVIDEHAHDMGSEVFYCIRGKSRMTVDGNVLTLGAGDCLVVEKDESHSFDEVIEETELLYFFVLNPSS